MFNFLLAAAPTVLGYLNDRDDVSRRNRERLKEGKRNEAQYQNDFNRDVVKWRNDTNNRDIEVDEKWQTVLGKINSDDLKLWSGISQGGIAAQQAYAAMMSVGASEQTGARSATTTNRRQAVLKYAGKMNEISARISLAKDTAALNRTAWGQEFANFAQASQVKNIEGRPMPGTPPPSIPLENQPDVLTGLILPLAGDYMGWKKQKDVLDPPYKDEEMRPNPPTEPSIPGEATPGGNPFEVPAEGMPEFDWGSIGGKEELLGDFLTKGLRNRASNRLGSSFQLSAT